MDWSRDANDRRSTMGTFFCLRWAHFVEMQETTTIALSMTEVKTIGALPS